MLPYFNTAGPCIPDEHYMLWPAKRFARIEQLIDERKYFTVHAGRQTGKTTSARWLVDKYNEGETYSALWVDIQTAREIDDPARAMPLVLQAFDWSTELDLPEVQRPDTEQIETWLKKPEQSVQAYLRTLAQAAPRPLVVLIDEADGLVGEAMVSFLTQLRAGYIARSKAPFPHSLALIGMRQVRDFVLSSEDRRTLTWLGTTSPFNITAEASTLAPFDYDDVTDLLGLHTDHTGQAFETEAIKQIYYLSQGHPWLVNAMADQIVNRDVEDRSVAVTAVHVEAAKETIIIERRTHIDSLIARLRETRVRRIIEPMLTGKAMPADLLDDDLSYVIGLGLVRIHQGQVTIANPIYREVIPRALTFISQHQIRHETAWFVREDGGLDMAKLIGAWQKFWRKDGHLAAEGFHYREAGPHLMLMAFLQRIVNSGGKVEREYGLGRGALDLMLLFGGERYVVEVKLRRDTETEAEALEQVRDYLDVADVDEGWLVLFDLRKVNKSKATITWQERLFQRDELVDDKTIHIIGC